MKPALSLCCAVVFTLGSWLGASFSTGCGGDDSASTDCMCPEQPAVPDAQSLPLARMLTHDPSNAAATLVQTPVGTVAVSGDRAVITYRQQDTTNVVTYSVMPRATAP